MNRLRIKKRLYVAGYDFYNRTAELIIEPLADENDSRWLIDVDGTDVEITPELFKALGRDIALVVTERVVFREFEHVGFLHALGLRGVRVHLRSRQWPPFLCSKELLRQLRDHAYEADSLAPQCYAKWHYEEKGRRRWHRKQFRRAISYDPGNNRQSMHLRVRVQYGASVPIERELTFPRDMRDIQVESIASSRTLGQPWFLRPLAWLVGTLPLVKHQRWPHRRKLHWQPGAREEVAHGLLDKMIFSFIASSDYRVVGEIYSYCSSHALDVSLMQQLFFYARRYARTQEARAPNQAA